MKFFLQFVIPSPLPKQGLRSRSTYLNEISTVNDIGPSKELSERCNHLN